MVCGLPLLCDCTAANVVVPLQRDLITLRSRAAPRQRVSSLRSVCTDFVT